MQAIPYFDSLSEITKSVLLDLIVCDQNHNLQVVCEWLASLHDEDPINMMASVSSQTTSKFHLKCLFPG